MGKQQKPGKTGKNFILRVSSDSEEERAKSAETFTFVSATPKTAGLVAERLVLAWANDLVYSEALPITVTWELFVGSLSGKPSKTGFKKLVPAEIVVQKRINRMRGRDYFKNNEGYFANINRKWAEKNPEKRAKVVKKSKANSKALLDSDPITKQLHLEQIKQRRKQKQLDQKKQETDNAN